MRIRSGLDDAGWHDLQESGAYEWWYVDAIGEDGRTALVLIWFAGLPFSPDYLTDHERGRSPRALDHAALFAAVYRDGRQICYALNRHDASDVEASREGVRVRVGHSSVAWEPETAAFAVYVDAPLLLGGARLRARLELEPELEISAVDLGPGGGSDDHVWNPVAPACRVAGEIEATDRSGAPAWNERFAGRGYVDHNFGRRPLTEGIARWHWGRLHAGDTTVVYYHNEPASGPPETVLAALARSRAPALAQAVTFEAGGWRRRPLCPRFPTLVTLRGEAGGRELRLEGAVRHILDWGPFYMRFLTSFRGEVEGRHVEGAGISEYLDPRGLRVRALRPLIKTRIRRVSPGG